MAQSEIICASVRERLSKAGIRETRQRIMLGSLLWKGDGCRHVTAEQLHQEAVEAGMRVSLATVYNTLHQFTEVGLLRHIMLNGGRCYFDTNMEPHHHFLNEKTGYIEDIPAHLIDIKGIPSPTCGAKIDAVDVIIRIR